MAKQFELFRLGDGTLVVVLQADLLSDLRTRVVAPLLPEETTPTMRGLTVRIEVEGRAYLILPQLMATLTLAELGTRVGSAAHLRDRLVDALDLTFTGI